MMRKVLDRLTPVRSRVVYGPNRSLDEHDEPGAYRWMCNRCWARGKGIGGYTRSLHAARANAKVHARTHLAMRAVYSEG